MKVILQILIVILQLIAANLLGFALAVALGLGNGWELVVFVLGFSLGVWGVGALAARLNKTYQSRNQFIRLASALAAEYAGCDDHPDHPGDRLYPQAGAFLGYYLPGWVLKR
jgi:malonyl CoA-acyl carrier protein transacylase